MAESYILSIDQGTTGTKIILIDKNKKIACSSYKKHKQYYPKSGWGEHDPEEIWTNIVAVAKEIVTEAQINPDQIAAIGLANQGETCLFWDPETGAPLYNAILWSDNRSKDICTEWTADDQWNQKIKEKTGLKIDPYFSATKFKWMMENVDDIKASVQTGKYAYGTLDTWLLWKMTNGKSYLTDASTASRTLLYNIHTDGWDQEILDYLGMEKDKLPTVQSSDSYFGLSDKEAFGGIEAPIQCSMVDQPAALYGHLCIEPGTSKCTYGTGGFVYMNVGKQVPEQTEGNELLSCVVWKKGDSITYSFDGSVYSAGSLVEWGKDELELYRSIDELQNWSQQWSRNIEAQTNLWCVPSFSGLATPFWNSKACGAFIGLGHSTGKQEMAKAILEGIAHRVADVFEEMEARTSTKISALKVDGRLTENPYLMQYQANVLGIPIKVTETLETTGLGVGYMAGEAIGWWDEEALKQADNGIEEIFYPQFEEENREKNRDKWRKVVNMIHNFYA